MVRINPMLCLVTGEDIKILNILLSLIGIEATAVAFADALVPLCYVLTSILSSQVPFAYPTICEIMRDNKNNTKAPYPKY